MGRASVVFRDETRGDLARFAGRKEIEKSEEKQPDYDPRGEIGNPARRLVARA
jgi:hypothetical protein